VIPRAASRKVCLLLLLVLVSLSVVPMVACSSKSPTSASGSCGSGDVYLWVPGSPAGDFRIVLIGLTPKRAGGGLA